MTDMPVALASYFSPSALDGIMGRVENMKPLLDIIRDTWSRETLREIMDGRVFVSDKLINRAIAERLGKSSVIPLTELQLTSDEDKLHIAAATKGGDTIEMSGSIKEFVHKGNQTFVVYKIGERKFPGHGIYSWLFANLSLSAVQSLMGDLGLGEGLPIKVEGNTVRLDFSDLVSASSFGQAKIGEVRLSDAVQILGCRPRKGGLEIRTKLDMPEIYQILLQDMVNRLGR